MSEERGGFAKNQRWEGGPGPEEPNYWKMVVFLFFLGWVLIYANRTVLSPLFKIFEEQWGLTRTQLGLLNSAFFLVYTLMQVPAGLLADRLRRKWVLLPGFFLQGLGVLAGGLATSYPFFLFSRVVTGLGQSTFYSTQYALAQAALPQEKRALGTSIINSGMSFGIAGGLALGSLLVYNLALDWRVPFYLLSVLTLLLSGVMAWLIAEGPSRSGPGAAVFAAAAERTGGSSGRRDGQSGQHKGAAQGRTWTSLLTRDLLLSYLTVFATMYGFFVILTWLPFYLQTVRGYTGGEAGLISFLVPLCAVPAGLLAGRLSDRLGRRRPVMLGLLPLSTLALLLIVLASSRQGLLLGLVLYGAAGKLVLDPLMVAMVADVTPPSLYATAFGVLNFCGTISTVLAPAITGYLADLTGSFTSGFYLAALLQGVAFAALLGVRERGRSPVAQLSVAHSRS